MFIRIEAHQYARHARLIEGYLKLRKTVFADELEWDVACTGDLERDAYDDCDPVYLLWTDEARTKVYAGLRLMPTTGPTLLHDVFSRTFGPDVDLVDPSVWECTRLCFDHDLLLADLQTAPRRAMMLMIAFAHEVAHDVGITTLVSNYEPQHKRLYERAGVEFEEIGRADGYGRRPVCCGLFDVSREAIANMRATLKIGRLQPKNASQRTREWPSCVPGRRKTEAGTASPFTAAADLDRSIVPSMVPQFDDGPTRAAWAT